MEGNRSPTGTEYQGIHKQTEKLLQSQNIPMDCYLLTTLIVIHFNYESFKSYYKKQTFSRITKFIRNIPYIIISLLSGIIVFLIQNYILIKFVESSAKNDESNVSTLFNMKLIVLIVFSLMIFNNYVIGVKKIVIGFFMPTLSGKLVTIIFSFFQALVTLIVYFCSTFVIKNVDNIEDLIQNFTALYVILQIDEVFYAFLSISTFLKSLSCLGVKKDKIEYVERLKSFWKGKKDENAEFDRKKINKAIKLSVKIGNIIFFVYVAVLTYFVLYLNGKLEDFMS